MLDIELVEIDLPEFGLPTDEPVIPAAVYAARLTAARERMSSVCDVWVVYGDREHAANLAYLTGYDPRFEEALLIVPGIGDPWLLVGNEGWSYAAISPLCLHKLLYQNFSLPGQPRGKSQPLEAIFRAAGIRSGSRVGVVGWKYFSSGDSQDYTHWLDIPSYIADLLRDLVGQSGDVVNLTHTVINPADGLKAINEVEQLACFEYSASYASQSVRNVLFGLRAGMSERDAVRLMELDGQPLSVHLMLSSGERTKYGLASPSNRVIQQGDPITVALGLWGALNARAGFAVAHPDELPEGIHDYVEKLVKPYFRAAVAWYETVGIGVRGGDLYDAVHEIIGDAFFGVHLNPGHLIHLDEWVDSPVFAGSDIPLRSGMALQVDIIPATGTPYFTTNIEDGIALADVNLRAAFQHQYPHAWNRIQARRSFMENVLGIRLKPEVLPFSNIPAYLPPFWLSPQLALQMNKRSA